MSPDRPSSSKFDRPVGGDIVVPPFVVEICEILSLRGPETRVLAALDDLRDHCRRRIRDFVEAQRKFRG